MPHIKPDEQLLPLSLLPLLHDCLHGPVPRYYAELEEIYQSCGNLQALAEEHEVLYEEYLRLKEQEAAELDGKGVVRWSRNLHAALGKKSAAQKAQDIMNRMWQQRYNWQYLVAVRNRYIQYKHSWRKLKEIAPEEKAKALSHLPFASLTKEQLDHLAKHKVYLAAATSSPAYLSPMPQSALKCNHWIHMCRRMARESGKEGGELLRERVQRDVTEEWRCEWYQAAWLDK